MKEIITSLERNELKTLVKEALKEVRQEEEKKKTERTFSINQARKIAKVSHYKMKKLVETGVIKILNCNRISESELDKYLEK
jgi:hypothetical protein